MNTYNRVEQELNNIYKDSPIKPRPYQIEAVAALDQFFEDTRGQNLNPLFWMATGLGKTIIFSMIIRLYLERWPNLRITVLAATKELIEQAEEKIYTMYPLAPVGVYCASMNRKEVNQITVASRGSIANNPIVLGHQDLVLVDESDEIPEAETSQYKKIISDLKSVNPFLKVIGFTATPFWSKDVIYKNGSKSDDKKIFDQVVYKRDLKWGIDNGFLVKPHTNWVKSGEIDTSKLRTSSNGEFIQKDVEAASLSEKLVFEAVNEWYEKAYTTRQLSVFFCCSIAHAELVAKVLWNKGIDAPIIHGGTPKKTRESLLSSAREGSIPVLLNVNVLTRGTDIPRLDCLVILRATNSLRLIIQIIGRGLRLCEETNKVDCLVLDFGENSKRFGVLDKAMPPKKKNEPDRVKECPQCEQAVGVFKQKCPHCGHQLKPSASKECASCGEPNSLGAKVCSGCSQPFVTHKVAPAKGDLISSDSMIRSFSVKSVTAQESTARNGKKYLRVCYWSNGFDVHFSNLFFESDGLHGEQLNYWQNIVTDTTLIPSTVDQAVSMCLSNSGLLKIPSTISVDLASKFKDIVHINY